VFDVGLGKIRGLAASIVFTAVGIAAAVAQSANISIPAQSLSAALRAVAQQTGVNILFVPSSVSGLQAHSLNGEMTAIEAVWALIQGMRLEVISDGNGGLLVRPAPPPTHAQNIPAPQSQAAVADRPTSAANPEDIAIEEVVVTGTSIRGTAPIGSNLISFGQPDIQNTPSADVNEVLRAIPSLTASQASGQGGDASDFQPNIHQLGGSASNSTLVLIDGHRTALTGINHPLVDPSILAPIMLERIEVLPDGASSIYGSDAVAGVINFVTRKRFEGLLLNGSTGFGDGYSRYNADILWGTDWRDGGALFSYSYSYQSELKVSARPWVHGDHTAVGGTNFKSFACSPATVQPAGSNNIFLSPQSSLSVTNTAATSACDNAIYGDLLPREIRHSVVAKFRQSFGTRLITSLDFVFGNRTDDSIVSRGNVTATVFSAGGQANPFFVTPPGTISTEQTVRWDADALLGPGAQTLNGAENGYLNFNAEYELVGNWRLTLLALIGKDHSYGYNQGQLCTSCAYEALNGTTSGSGDTTLPSIPGTTTTILQLPLTTSNALDVWDPPATNKTSPMVLANLTDSATATDFYNTINQLRLGGDGTLFELPGGPVKAALGSEFLKYDLNEHQTNVLGTGPASAGGSSLHEYQFQRSVKAFYGELDIALVGRPNALPLVEGLDVGLSGRYDSYSDVGPTFNPKIGIDWQLISWIKLRGSMSKSFVAPSDDILGNQYGNHSGSGFVPSTASFQVTTAAYPLAGLLPGCSPSLPTCNISSGTPGVEINNGDPNIKPQIGFSWSLGADFVPDFLPGFTLNLTYFNNKFDGANTAPEIASIVAAPALQYLLTIYPNGATAAQIAATTAHIPQAGALPSTVYYIYSHAQQNILNLHIEGFDLSAIHSLDAGPYGRFLIGEALTEFTNYTVQNGFGTPIYSTLDTDGIISIFPMVQTQMRVTLDWERGPFQLGLYSNFTGSYRNWGANTVSPILYDPVSGSPVGGGDIVKSNLTFDARLSFDFNNKWLGGTELYLTALNVLSTRPPFFNSAQAYDKFEANPTGRVISIGLRTKL
jgi:iron complex outermembrane receptor protein